MTGPSTSPLISIEAALTTDQNIADASVAATNRPVYIETYGCQMNVADTELVASILREAARRRAAERGPDRPAAREGS